MRRGEWCASRPCWLSEEHAGKAASAIEYRRNIWAAMNEGFRPRRGRGGLENRGSRRRETARSSTHKPIAKADLGCAAQRPLLGVDRTLRGLVSMSANDPKRTLKDKLSSRWCYQPTRVRLSGS